MVPSGCEEYGRRTARVLRSRQGRSATAFARGRVRSGRENRRHHLAQEGDGLAQRHGVQTADVLLQIFSLCVPGESFEAMTVELNLSEASGIVEGDLDIKVRAGAVI